MKIKIEGDTKMGSALKVAFATNDMETVNAHFGATKEFVVYGVNKDGYEMIEVIKADGKDVEGDKTEAKVKALAGVNIVYCESIGGTSAAKVIRAGIHPMKTPEPLPIEDLLVRFQRMLQDNPPPWIKKIVTKEEG